MLESTFDVNFHKVLLEWPPFYTLQEHAETRAKQLKYWAEITHLHFIKNNINESSLSELSSEGFKLYQDNSTGVPKRLNKAEIESILKEMLSQGKIEWKNQNLKDNFLVFQYSVSEISDALYAWAKKWGKVGTIETVRYIIDGDDTDKTEKFYGVPDEVVLKALKLLEANGKAQVFEVEPNRYGVKFL